MPHVFFQYENVYSSNIPTIVNTHLEFGYVSLQITWYDLHTLIYFKKYDHTLCQILSFLPIPNPLIYPKKTKKKMIPTQPCYGPHHSSSHKL